MTSDWSDSVVAVTGAASGMGRATALEFLRLGATVAAVDRDASGLDGLQHDAATIGAQRLSVHVGDVADAEFCRSAIDGVAAEQGRLDVLVNAAGTIHRADALGTEDDDWRRVLSVNVDGVFFLSRAAIPHLRHTGGCIVNFGSIWGGVAAAGVTAYCVSKGAVHQLTKAMALDHIEDGIRINAVAPGEVNTPMLASQRESVPTAADLQALADATIPMKRLAEPIEVARVVVFLASDAASYMTGEIVHVDGGYTAR